jgi:Ankyrin repeats (many copies)
MAGDLARVQNMLAVGAHPNAQEKQGWTPLLLAAQLGHSDIVKALLAAHADANMTGPGGWNALMQASYRGDLESVQALIPATNLNYRNKDDISALMLARWGCHSNVSQLLRDKGALTDRSEWQRAPAFTDFPARRIHKGAPAKVDLTSNPLAREYRTRLREGARQGPNFAGHYAMVSWGCGTSCQVYALVDSLSGKVYDGFGAERGADFKLNSDLVIADPPYFQPDGDDDPIARMPVRYLVWKDNSWRLVYEQSCSAANPGCRCESSKSLTLSNKPAP